MLRLLCLSAALLTASPAGATPQPAAGRSPEDLVKEMNVEIRDQQRASAKAAEEAQAEEEEKRAHASHLAKFVSHMTATVKDARAEEFAEAKARFEATRAHMRSRPVVRNRGHKQQHVPSWHNSTSLMQGFAEPVGSLQDAGQELLREVAKQKAESKRKAQIKASPLSQFVSAIGSSEKVDKKAKAKKAILDIKEEQRNFDERRKQLLARKDSPARLAAAARAAAKAAKKNATKLALHSSNQTLKPKLHPGKAPMTRVLAVKKSAKQIEQEKMLDFKTRQCVDEGSGCFEKFEVCAQDFCSVTKLPQEECVQRAVSAYHRLEKSGAKVDLSCDATPSRTHVH